MPDIDIMIAKGICPKCNPFVIQKEGEPLPEKWGILFRIEKPKLDIFLCLGCIQEIMDTARELAKKQKKEKASYVE